jgi:hypothetical protein
MRSAARAERGAMEVILRPERMEATCLKGSDRDELSSNQAESARTVPGVNPPAGSSRRRLSWRRGRCCRLRGVHRGHLGRRTDSLSAKSAKLAICGDIRRAFRVMSHRCRRFGRASLEDWQFSGAPAYAEYLKIRYNASS